MIGVLASRLPSLDSEVHRFIFPYVIAGPEPIEQIEPEVAADRLLDHLALALSRTCGAYLHRAEDLFIDGQSCARLCHTGMIAS